MLIKKHISLQFTIRNSWRNLLYVFIASVLSYTVNYLYLDEFVDTPTMIPTILGTALAFFIGFNNNQAYDRWWEARKIWGMIVNTSRSWARQWLHYSTVSDQLPMDVLKRLRIGAIHRQVAFVYSLKESLRGTSKMKHHKFLSKEEISRVDNESNTPNALLSEHARDLQFLYESGGVDGFRFQEMNRTLNAICDEMGKCERIKNTVFPPTYNYYTRIFVFIFVILEVLGTVNDIGLWSIVTGSMIGYIFLTTQAIGLALLNPFEMNPASLPLDQITRTIEINLFEMEGAVRIPKPIVPKGQEFIT